MLAEVKASGDIHSTRVLSLDSTGRILDWMSWQDAVCLYVRGAVAWTLGDPCLTIHGGFNQRSGEQSLLDLHPIVASTGHARGGSIDPAPALTNVALFARDRMLCLYCGHHFSRGELTESHAETMSGLLEKYRQSLETEQLEARLQALEQRGKRTEDAS